MYLKLWLYGVKGPGNLNYSVETVEIHLLGLFQCIMCRLYSVHVCKPQTYIHRNHVNELYICILYIHIHVGLQCKEQEIHSHTKNQSFETIQSTSISRHWYVYLKVGMESISKILKKWIFSQSILKCLWHVYRTLKMLCFLLLHSL